MAKPFVLSPEDAEFVSSSEYILNQIENGRYDSSNDFVHYSIYFDVAHYDSEQNVLTLYETVKKYLDSLSSIYIWHKDKLVLNYVCNLSDKLKPKYFFEGKTYYGDNIDDEWFIVYMFLQLSSEIPHLNISIIDNDGEFLLIEASDHIPQWITPENCSNRVWLRNGKLNIIPLEESSCKTTENGILLLAALNYMNTPNNTSVCNISAQNCILNRTNQYPNKIKAAYHNTVCIVPIHVAFILQSHPNIISDVLACFCNGTKANKTHMSNLNKFGINDVIKNDSNFVCIKILLTRAMYAKLMFQSFHPPKKLHKVMNKVVSNFVRKEEMKPNATSNSVSLAMRLATKAFDIGCRLMCGLEVLYQNSKGNVLKYSNQLTDKPDVFIDNSLMTLVSNSDLIHQIVLSETLEVDSASWLYLKPEEFEKEMNDRMCGGSNIHSDNVAESDINSINMMQNLEKMVKNMHLFMESESGIDGVEVNVSAGDNSNNEELGNTDIDIEKIYKALEKHSAALSSKNESFETDYNGYFSSDDESTLDCDSEDEESDMLDAVNGTSSYILKDGNDDFKDFDFTRPDDSDDEDSNASVGKEKDEHFFSSYMEEMDNQLLGESLSSSFERSAKENDDDILGPVDIDTNLLKYYLESHASQLEEGIPGPISALMTTLGIKLPLEKS